MAFSIGDFFPLRGSRMAARMARIASRRGTPARAPHAKAGKRSAFRFEAVEPRLLLAADVFLGDKDAFLANPLLGTETYVELFEGLSLVDNVAVDVDNTSVWQDAMGTFIPGLLIRDTGIPQTFIPPTLGSVLNSEDGHDNGSFQPILNAVSQLLADTDEAASPVTFAANLEALNDSLGQIGITVNLLDADSDPDNGIQTFFLKSLGGNDYEFLYNLEIVVSTTESEDGKDSFSLDFGRNADALEIDYDADANSEAHLPLIPLQSQYRFNATVGVKATITQDDNYDDDGDPDTDGVTATVVDVTGGFIRDAGFSAGIEADVATPIIDVLKFGFLDVRATAGTAEFDMRVEASLAGTFFSSGDIDDADPDVDTAGLIDVNLPIDVAPAGILGGNGFGTYEPTIRLYTPDPFASVHEPVTVINGDNRTAILIDLLEFEGLNPFRNLDAAGLANVFSGLQTMLQQLQAKAQLFGLELPLLDSTKISDVLAFDEPMRLLYEKLTLEFNGARVAAFSTVQGFVTVLENALNDLLADYNATDFDDATVAAITPRYVLEDGKPPTLLFTIELHAGLTGSPIEVGGSLGLDLAPLGEIAMSGQMDFRNRFDLTLTLGIELAEPPDVGVVNAAQTSALVGAVLADEVLAGDVEFNLVLGGQGSVRVELAAGDYTGGLAAALQTAIASAISSAVSAGDLPAQTPGSAVSVSMNPQDRLVISSTALPYLQIVLPAGGAVAELGYRDLQRATTSRLPVDGRLSSDATFKLTIGGTTHDIVLDDGATTGNSTVAELVADLNDAITALGKFSAGTYATLTGNEVVGWRVKISSGTQFVRIDQVGGSAAPELGLLDDTLSSRLQIRGDSAMAVGMNAQNFALPANGNLADPLAFTVQLVQGASDSGAIDVSVVLGANGVAGNAGQSAVNAATDINKALAEITIPGTGGQKLGAVLVATAVEFQKQDANGRYQPQGVWGIRFSQPVAALDTPLQYAFADEITIAGIDAQGNGNDQIGLADGSSTGYRIGPSVDETLSNVASFTINVTGGSGAVTQQAISLDPNALSDNDLPTVIDEINLQIAGGALAGRVVAGLDGTRLVMGVVGASDTVIELSSVNTVARDDLGIEEGISARTFEGVQAFLQDVSLDASLDFEGSAQGAANFGFVSLSLGEAEAALEAAVAIDFGSGETAGVKDRIYVKDIFKAFSRPFSDADGGLIDVLEGSGGNGVLLGLSGANEEIDLSGSFTLDWDGAGDISVPGLAGGVADDLDSELAEVTDPYIHIAMTDLTDLIGGGPLDSLSVDADLGSLVDLADFSFDDAIAALRAIADWLQSYVQSLDIINEPLPLLGVSLADALAFIDDFAAAVDDIAANPTKSLQGLLDKVNEGMQRFIGPFAEIGYQSNSPGVLTFQLGFARNYADILPIEIDMVQLLEDETGIDVPGLELAGAANLAAEFSIDAMLVFGVNVDAFAAVLDQPSYLSDDLLDELFLVVEASNSYGIAEYTRLDLEAFASADNVTFTGSLGPLGLFVSDGGAVLNEAGVLGNTDPAFIKVSLPDVGADDGVITLKDLLSGAYFDDIFDTANVDVSLGLAAVLPVSFPTSSNFIGNLDFSATVTDPFSADGYDFTLNSIPDFSQIDLDNLGLLDTINLFLAGADTVLGSLGDLITGELFGADDVTDLPLVGDALEDAGAFIDEIRNEVIPQITNIIETAPELVADIFKDIGFVLQDALSTLSFLGSSVKLHVFDGDGVDIGLYDFDPVVSSASGYFDDLSDDIFAARGFSFTIDLGVDFQITPASSNLNLEVFQLNFDGLSVDIRADLTFGLGVSLDKGFFFEVNPEGEADLSGSITVNLPQTFEADLFFLGLTAVNNNIDDKDTVTTDDDVRLAHDLIAAFSVDLTGATDGRFGFGEIGDIGFDVDFGAEVDLDLQLKLGLSSNVGIGLPKIVADFQLAWGFGDVTVNAGDYPLVGDGQIGIDADHPEAPTLSLGNVRLDIGSFLGDTLGPFITDLYEVLEPIDPILDILTDPIPVLSDLLGPTSLLDVAATFGIVNPGLVTALELLDQVVDFASTVAEGADGYVTIFAGKFELGKGGMDIRDPGQVGALTDPSQVFTTVLAGLEGLGLDLPDEFGTVANFLLSGFDQGELPGVSGDSPIGKDGSPSGGFSFPFLENFDEVLGLFFGRNMTLIAYDLPPLEFGFDFSIYVPIWDGLGARFAGGINAVIDLAFGYDTEGIFQFANGGFNPLDLAAGFFVYDDNPFGGFAGIDVPEVEITGRITAAAELNLVVASAGVGGGIFATVGFDLADPDGDLRVRLEELWANLFNSDVGPLGLFDVSAKIEARLFAYIEALFGIWRKEFALGPSIPLYEETYVVERDPVLATDLENGTLRLNMGEFAVDRAWTNNGADDPVDTAEEFEIRIVDADTIEVRGRGELVDGSYEDFDAWSDWQTYNSKNGNFNRIIAKAGQGNDSVRIVSDATGGTVRAEFEGGTGDDILEGGNAADTLLGETGSDHLIGGAGNDLLDGGAGDDCLEGGDDNDVVIGGAGQDVLLGEAGDDRLFGGAGDDIVSAGSGADVADGGEGRDLIAGGADADILLGQSGDDRIWGDYEFDIVDCVLQTTDTGDEPGFLALGTEGDDYISGGAGSDEIQGNGGNDWIWGDSSFVLDANYALQGSGAGVLRILPIFGTFGADNLSGGAGDDTIYGEAGNDIIRGDNLRVDSAATNDGNPFTWAEGDRFSAGTAHGGTDGDDTLFGGRDSDIVYGNGGEDTVAGGTENDILFGNAGDDTLTGDVGADVIFGDNGIVEVFVENDDVGDGVLYDAPTQDFKLLESYSDAGDGDDWIDAGQDNDIVFGGGGLGLQASDPDVGQTIEDLIKAGSGDDIAFGDHGRVTFTYTVAAGRAFATLIRSTDQDFGGDDQIFGSTGRDILIGGKGGDFINGDDGFNADDPDSRDVVAGDHIRMEQAVTLVTITPHEKVADVYVAAPTRIVSTETAPGQGGDDTLDGRQDNDIIIGGPGDDRGTGGRGHDVLLGDRGEVVFDISFITPAVEGYQFDRDELFVLQTVRSTDLALADIPFTGVDEMSGGDGNDVVIGGGQGDFLFGDAELDGSVGELLDGDGDILIGDNGQVDYLQHGTLARVFTTDVMDDTGGDDSIEGNAGVDIAMGGVGADDIWGDATVALGDDGDDILLGDNGLVDFSLDLDLNLALTGAAPANLATLDRIESYTDGFGDIDTIRGNTGSDVAMGGTAGDWIYGDDEDASSAGDDGDDMLMGDNGLVLLVNPGLDLIANGTDRRLVRGGAVALLRSTDEDDAADDTGGRDTIEGNAGGDIMLGGVRGDWLYGDRVGATVTSNADDGYDTILGDNGALEWLSTGRLLDLPEDVRNGDSRWNSSLDDAFVLRNSNLDILDLITTEQPNNGGRDLIVGGNGRDTAFGGTDADTIYGDSGSEADGLNGTGNANDLLFGDHGRLYVQLGAINLAPTLPEAIHSRNFFAIHTGQGDGGEGDRLWGEEGMDIMLGQQGDDRLWGGSGDDDLIGGHNVEGGVDELDVTTITISTGGNAWNDLMDGGSQNDTMAGDNSVVWRTGLVTSPRYQLLTAATLYTTTESTVTVNVSTDPLADAQQDPDGTRGRFVFLLDHADDTADDLYGRDVMAGGSERDTMFGQLGNDLMQGDGLISDDSSAGELSTVLDVADTAVLAPADLTDGVHHFRIPEQTSDADDYMEGNGGNDTMYGGLGQDDMIGGNSELYGLATPEQRPDGSDWMWGGAGVQTARLDQGYLQTLADGSDPAGLVAESFVASERGRDADTMVGDNANIFRVVRPLAGPGVVNNEYVRFNYDVSMTGYTGGNLLVVRAMQWLDYTLGGPDFDQDLLVNGIQTTQDADNGAGDYMHGEAGNDTIHGMAGSDILFGDAHDDDITGGYGHDWISGGTGQDGVIGDDGLIRTSRNSTLGEPLFGVAGLNGNDTRYSDGDVLGEVITTPGSIQRAIINVEGELTKAMDLTPLTVDARWMAVDDEFGYAGDSSAFGAPYADDLIYGGLGSDWLHGGSGDDGISGAEALPVYFEAANGATPSTGTTNNSGVNYGDQLRFNPIDVVSNHERERAGEFALYDEYNPRRQIRVNLSDGWGGELVESGGFDFILNFNENEGVVRASEDVPTNGKNIIVTGPVRDDGDDKIFGDTGNDWLVGGTGRDNVYGGWGNDLMNVDDDQTFDVNGVVLNSEILNDTPDTHSTYEDRAYGGAGRDVLIGNTGGDRLIDWVGEWNSYLVPFAPFGMATVSRTLQPQLPEFLFALSRADGADPTIVADGNGSALRNGEPYGEMGLVLQKDDAWQDQTGAPADPQAGNIPGGKRDVLRSADFNNQQGQGFVPESGSWKISSGKYEVAPATTGSNKDAISLYFTGEPLPLYFEVAATINAIKPTGGFKANAYIIFDYVSPTDFKFAGLNVSTNKVEIGQRASWGFQVLKSTNMLLKSGQDYNVLLAVNGNAVTFVVNGSTSVSHAFDARIDNLGTAHPIRDAMVGLGGDNAKARIDDVRLQILPPNFAWQATDGFDAAPQLLASAAGSWAQSAGHFSGSPASSTGIALADNDIAVGANAVLQIDAKLALSAPSSIAGITFDKYSDTDFKWAGLSLATKQVLVGHYTAKGGWVVDQAIARADLTTNVDYTLGVTLKGSTINLTLNGITVLSRAYNAGVVDGAVGVFTKGGAASFDSFGLKTDDVTFAAGMASGSMAASTTSVASSSGPTERLASAAEPVPAGMTSSEPTPTTLSIESAEPIRLQSTLAGNSLAVDDELGFTASLRGSSAWPVTAAVPESTMFATSAASTGVDQDLARLRAAAVPARPIAIDWTAGPASEAAAAPQGGWQLEFLTALEAGQGLSRANRSMSLLV